MTKNNSCTLRILNKNYDIKCPENEASNLLLAGEKLNEQLLQTKKNFAKLDDYHVLLLAAIHISHELISCQKQQEQQRHQVTQFISSLENKINQVVNGTTEFEPQTD